jgi:hypothetical protein
MKGWAAIRLGGSFADDVLVPTGLHSSDINRGQTELVAKNAKPGLSK